MEILRGELVRNEVTINAMGGTEIMTAELANRANQDLLKQFQIVPSRVRDLHQDVFRIFWAHDLPGDPESEFLKNEGWRKFHRLVFVSNWQMQAYITHYGIPWSHCVVIGNAIEPIPVAQKPTDKIKLIYTSTPHRGLNILLPVFDKLCEKHDDIELDVYSSFKLYGFDQRDEPFRQLFDYAENHPKINYYGAVDHDVVVEALSQSHIFAYPSIWNETFCLCLAEAMSAGLICVHSNLGCLFETAGKWTYMYQFNEDLNAHANIFYAALDQAINDVRSDHFDVLSKSQKTYADLFHGWGDKIGAWNGLMSQIVQANPPKEIAGDRFVYRV